MTLRYAQPAARASKSGSQARSGNEGVLVVDTGAGGLSTLIRGSGPPLVLLHGLTANRTFWDPVIPLLVGRHTIVAPDLLGRGRSYPAPGTDYSMLSERDRLLALIRGLRLERPLIVGHSHGASLALVVAGAPIVGRHRPAGLLLLSPVTPWTRRPRLVPVLTARVVRPIVVPVARSFRRPLTRYVLERRVLADGRKPSADLVDSFSSAYATREGVETLLDVLQDWSPSDLTEWMTRPTVPVRMLAGDEDRRISSAHTRRLARRLGAPLRFVPKAGHGLTLDAASEVAREIEKLREEIRS